MKTLKAILNQTVDLILGLIALGLVIWYMIEPSNNFSGALILYVGYVAFNIKEKVKMVLNRKDICKSCGKLMRGRGEIEYICMNPYCDDYIKSPQTDNDNEEFFHTVV